MSDHRTVVDHTSRRGVGMNRCYPRVDRNQDLPHLDAEPGQQPRDPHERAVAHLRWCRDFWHLLSHSASLSDFSH